MMSVTIVSVSTHGAYRKMAAASMCNHSLYAGLNGYGYQHRILSPEECAILSPSWHKIPIVNEILIRQNLYVYGKRSWVLWMDADAVFTSASSLEFLDKIPTSKIMAICKDDNGVNMGVFAVDTSNAALSLLLKIWEGRHEYRDHLWWEQGKFHAMIKADPTIMEKLEIVPHSELNAHPTDPSKKWKPGDRVLHFSGGGHPDARLSKMNELISSQASSAALSWFRAAIPTHQE